MDNETKPPYHKCIGCFGARTSALITTARFRCAGRTMTGSDICIYTRTIKTIATKKKK